MQDEQAKLEVLESHQHILFTTTEILILTQHNAIHLPAAP
jgi:hypothetical protein